VCERLLPPGPANRKLCKRAACRAEYRRFPHLFAFAGRNPGQPTGSVERPPKTSTKSGFFWRDASGRGWRWEQFGAEHWLFNRAEDVEARVIPADEHYVVRLSPGVDYGAPRPLDQAKRHAISLALARLPLEPKHAARLARQNELPPDPPQHLLPCTGSYLAGSEALQAASPKPFRIVDASAPEGDLRSIPSFLRRTEDCEEFEDMRNAA
jgi:hypothetical protein